MMLEPKFNWIPFDKNNPPTNLCNDTNYLIFLREDDYDDGATWTYSVDIATAYGRYLDDFWDTENDWKEGQRVEVLAYAELPYWQKEEDLHSEEKRVIEDIKIYNGHNYAGIQLQACQNGYTQGVNDTVKNIVEMLVNEHGYSPFSVIVKDIEKFELERYENMTVVTIEDLIALSRVEDVVLEMRIGPDGVITITAIDNEKGCDWTALSTDLDIMVISHIIKDTIRRVKNDARQIR